MFGRFGRETVSVSPVEAASLLEDGAVMLDVREAAEVRSGTVPGALHVPVGRLFDELHRLDRERLVLVICRSGARSAGATRALRQSGFDAKNVRGGYLRWAASGLPTTARPGGRRHR